jgi:hypothetical protein
MIQAQRIQAVLMLAPLLGIRCGWRQRAGRWRGSRSGRRRSRGDRLRGRQGLRFHDGLQSRSRYGIWLPCVGRRISMRVRAVPHSPTHAVRGRFRRFFTIRSSCWFRVFSCRLFTTGRARAHISRIRRNQMLIMYKCIPKLHRWIQENIREEL